MHEKFCFSIKKYLDNIYKGKLNIRVKNSLSFGKVFPFFVLVN